MSSTPTIASALAGPRNGFGLVRLALALAVVVSHAGSIASGDLCDEPLARATGFTLGEHAVNGFFAVSGFLVTMSFARRGARDYAIARALRILPGLVAAVLVTAFALGPAITRLSLPEYIAAPDLGRFVWQTLTGFRSQAHLPGVFEANPHHGVLGTIWTLRYEVYCYLGVLVAGATGLLGRRRIALVAVLALGLGTIVLRLFDGPPSKAVETNLRLPLIFVVGSVLYLWRDRVRLAAWPLLGLGGAWLLRDTAFYQTILFVSEAYGAIWLALAALPALGLADPRADLSYGVYLYGWPIQQTLHALWPAASGSWLLLPSIALVLPVAALSWFLVERPMLGSKARLRGTVEPAGP